MQPFSIVIHGGAGTILKSKMTTDLEQQYQDALKKAVNAGSKILENGGTALDSVEAAVMKMENTPLFNAGKGAVFTANGKHEMDASVMDGSNLNAGAVAIVQHVKNPVHLARLIMEKSGHVFLAGEGAEEFAMTQGCEMGDEAYFHNEFRYRQWQNIKGTDQTQLDHSILKDDKYGTVGAVACDQNGNIAAATSTGGTTNKKYGRIGDSPVIGAGNYANNRTAAISCTGTGEFFIRGMVAYDVACLIEFKNMDLQNACDLVIKERILEIGGDGGLIAVNSKAETALSFNTDGMYRASQQNGQKAVIQIYQD